MPELPITEEPGFRSLGFDGKEPFPSKKHEDDFVLFLANLLFIFNWQSVLLIAHTLHYSFLVFSALPRLLLAHIEVLPPKSVGFSFADVRIMSEDYSDDETLELQEEENAAENQRWRGSNSSERIRRSR